MRSLSRLTTLALVTLAVAAGVALADSPGPTPATKLATGARSSSAVGVSTPSSKATPAAETVGGTGAGPALAMSATKSASPVPKAVEPVTGSPCDNIAERLASVEATFAAAEQRLSDSLPPAQADPIIATLEATLSQVESALDAAGAACLAAVTTTTPPPPTIPGIGPVDCATLNDQRALVNAEIDAAEAELATVLSASDLAAATAELEAARSQANRAFDAGAAACATSPSSSTIPVVTTIPAATCSDIQAQKTAFNKALDATETTLRSLPQQQSAAAIAAVEDQRAIGNAKFDAALAKCSH